MRAALSAAIVLALVGSACGLDYLRAGGPPDASSDGASASEDAGGGRDGSATPRDGSSSELSCTKTADCPGGVCCAVRDTFGRVTSSCEASCGGGAVQMCDPSASNNGGCVQGACVVNPDNEHLSGAGTCGGACPGGC